MSYQEIIDQHKGKFGVFTHDMYKCSEEKYANGFLAAFEKFSDAWHYAKDNNAIHII